MVSCAGEHLNLGFFCPEYLKAISSFNVLFFQGEHKGPSPILGWLALCKPSDATSTASCWLAKDQASEEG